jgi:septum formation protein
MSEARIVLASASPRRKALLDQLGLQVEVMAVGIEEAVRGEEKPSDYVARLANDKARAARARLTDDCVVIAADTVVVIDDVILGKPADRDAFIEMLGLLSGRTHAVLTGVSVSVGGRVRTAVSRTSVRFRNIALHEMEAYWESGEPKDKAGGYGIQGVGGIFVERLEGSYSGVVGLPLAETEQMLTGLGVDLWKCREGGAGCEDGADWR